ncbi:hypothetical protein DFH28DRAFT_1078981 [Melampsora americana]|nr:hypothetical protein DFH28DRAFT_1078981 [Melampsora americana]
MENVKLDNENDEMIVDEKVNLDEGQVKRKGRGFKATGTDATDMDIDKNPTYERLDDTKEKEQTAGNAARSVEGWVIMVTGVHEEATEEDLQDKFSDYGSVMNLAMPLDRRTGYVKGYALVEYETRKEAETAIREGSGSNLLEQKLECDFAFVRAPTGISGVTSSTLKNRKQRSQSPPKRQLVNRID